MSSIYDPRSTDANIGLLRNPQGASTAPADFGAGMAFGAAATQQIKYDNPAAVGFRSAARFFADIAARNAPNGGDGIDAPLTEGLISREDFARVFESRHPGMAGKWRKGMSWWTADDMISALEGRERLSALQENRDLTAIAGGFAGGLVDPTNFVFPEAQLAGMTVGRAVGRAALYGFREGVITEVPTAVLQNYYLQEDRTILDTALAISASVVVPPALHVTGRAANYALGRAAGTVSTDLAYRDKARAAAETTGQPDGPASFDGGGIDTMPDLLAQAEGVGRAFDRTSADETAQRNIDKLVTGGEQPKAPDRPNVKVNTTEVGGAVASQELGLRSEATSKELGNQYRAELADKAQAARQATKSRDEALRRRSAVQKDADFRNIAALDKRDPGLAKRMQGASRSADDVVAELRSTARLPETPDIKRKGVVDPNVAVGKRLRFMTDYLRGIGRDLRIYDAADPKAQSLFGNSRGAAIFSDSRTIYIRSDQLGSVATMAKVVGHELGHTILYNSPAQWRNIVKTVVDSADPNVAKILRNTLDEFDRNPAFQKAGAAKRLDETIANVIGEVFSSQQFWDLYAARHGGSAMAQLAEYVRRFFANFVRSLKKLDPETSKGLRDTMVAVDKAIRATSDRAKKPGDLGAPTLPAFRERIYGEFGSRWHEMLKKHLTLEETEALAIVDEQFDDIVLEIPDEGGDTSMTRPKIGGYEYHVYKRVPSKDIPSSWVEMDKSDRRAYVQGLLSEIPNYAKKNAELAAARKASIDLGEGDTGEPLWTYGLDSKSNDLIIRVGYPDTHNPIKFTRVSEFSRAKTIVEEWFSEFGYNATTEELGKGKFDKTLLTDAAKRLQTLSEDASFLLFRGVDKDIKARFADINQPSTLQGPAIPSPVHPLIREFIDAPEFRGIFDLLSSEPVSKTTEKGGIAAETPRNLNTAHELFLDALDLFIERRRNEEIEARSALPDKYASWAEQVKDERKNISNFVSNEEAKSFKAREAKKSLAEKAALSGDTGTPERRADILNTTLKAFADLFNKTQEPVKPLPNRIVRELFFAKQTLAYWKALNISFAGTPEDLVRVLGAKKTGFHWHTIIDTVRQGGLPHRYVSDKVIARYGHEVPLNAKHRDIEMHDRLFEDVLREVNETQARLQAEFLGTVDRVREALEVTAPDKLADGSAAKVIAEKMRSLDLDQVVTIDGTTHTLREHRAFDIMREIMGESEFNRWLLFDTDRKNSFDQTTKNTYEARKRNDADYAGEDRLPMAPSGFNRIDDQTYELDPNDYEAQQALFNADLADSDMNPHAADEGMDHMPAPNDDVSRFARRNREQLEKAVEPFLNLEKAGDALLKTSSVVKKRLQALIGSNPKFESVRGLVDDINRTEFSANRHKTEAATLIKELADLGTIEQARTWANGPQSRVNPDLLSVVRYHVADPAKTFEEVVAAVEAAAALAGNKERFRALKNASVVLDKTSRGSMEQLYTDLDGQIRVAPAGESTVLKELKNHLFVDTTPGKYLTTGQSMEFRLKQVKALATARIHEIIDKIPKSVSGGTNEMAGVLKLAVRSIKEGAAAFNDTSLDPEGIRLVTELGKALDSSREIVRGMLNRSGAFIQKNDQFFFSLRHNLAAIRKDYKGWVEFMEASVDWEETFRRTGVDISSMRASEVLDRRTKFLDGMFAELENAERNVDAQPWDPVVDDLSKRDRWHRTIAFKEPGSMIDYDMKFGSKDTMTTIVNQLDKRAERAVIMDEWGPDYRKNFEHVVANLRTEATTKQGRALASSLESRLRTTFRYASGELNNPVNQTVASIQQSLSAIGNLAFSWMSTPSSITDVAHLKNTLRSVGAGYHMAFGKYLGSMWSNAGQYSGEVKELFRGNLAGLEAMISSTVRDTVGFGQPGWAGYLNDKIFSWNGQQRHTRMLQFAYADEMGHHLGSMARLVRDGGTVTPEMRRWLTSYQIDEKQFAEMAKDMESLSLRIDGEARDVLLPSMVSNPKLRQSLMFAFKDTMDHAVLQPSISDQALLTFGTRSGTAFGSAIRLMTQYKSFTMAMNRKVARRFRAYGLSEEAVQGLQLHRFYAAANLMGMALVATQIKDVLAGREPLTFFEDDQRTIENVHRIVLQAGMFTMLGDVGLDFSVDQKNGVELDLSSKGLGPVVGQATRLIGQIGSDAPNNFERATRTVLNSTPFATMPVWNQMKHHLWGALISDAYQLHTDSIIRAISLKTGQDQFIFNGKQ